MWLKLFNCESPDDLMTDSRFDVGLTLVLRAVGVRLTTQVRENEPHEKAVALHANLCDRSILVQILQARQVGQATCQ